MSKAQRNIARAVQIIGANSAVRDALEEQGSERVSMAKAAPAGVERELHLDIAADLFTLARRA